MIDTVDAPQFAKFDVGDWDIFAGAEEFGPDIDSSDPLVCYEIAIDGFGTLMVIDALGLHGQVLTDNGETISTFDVPMQKTLLWLAAGLKWSYDTGSLIDAGFVFESAS